MELKVVREAVVVVTSRLLRVNVAKCLVRCAISLSALVPLAVSGAVLPEDRADVMYHSYSGGGVTIDGPSVLVRKGFKEKFSISANYYVDNVSSASIDVELSASEYEEERTETSLGIDYLNNKSLVSFAVSKSEENDYEAESFHFNVTQDFFGDLSTLSLGYSRGADRVFRNDDSELNETVDRHHFRFGLTQVITRNIILSANYEGISDEGFLNNPYRQVRFIDPADPNNFRLESEIYPRTRTSDALAVGSMIYLPYRASLKVRARYFTDDWGIDASTAEIGYKHPFKEHWLFEARYRYYTQSAADFYNDLFPRADFQDFKARDKELSTFSSHSIGTTVSYTWQLKNVKFIEKASANFSFDHLRFDYEDFRDATISQNSVDVGAGSEPFYNFSANVIRFYVSFFY